MAATATVTVTASEVPRSVAILRNSLTTSINDTQLELYRADSNEKLKVAYLNYKSCQGAVAGVYKNIVETMSKSDAKSIYAASRAISNEVFSSDKSSVDKPDPDIEDNLITILSFTTQEQRQIFAKRRCDYCVTVLIPEVSALVSTLTSFSSNIQQQRKNIAIEAKQKSMCKFCINGNCRGSGKFYKFYTHTSQPVSQPLLIDNASSSSVSSDTHIVVENLGPGS